MRSEYVFFAAALLRWFYFCSGGNVTDAAFLSRGVKGGVSASRARRMGRSIA